MGKQEMNYICLIDAIRWENNELLKHVLSSNLYDLTQYNDKFFNMAISIGNIKTIFIMIKYYFDNAYNFDYGTSKQTSKEKLRDILYLAIKDIEDDAEDELIRVLQPYLNPEYEINSKLDYYIELTNYCRLNDFKLMRDILISNKDLDLTYENGVCFRFAIFHSNVVMLRILVQYYITQGNSEESLMVILNEILETENPEPEINMYLSQCL